MIMGVVFDDKNANQVQDGTEGTLSDWEITLTDLETNIILETTKTNLNGEYMFPDAATAFTEVKAEVRPGTEQTLPDPSGPTGGTYQVNVMSKSFPGETIILDFGNRQIVGTAVFDDFDDGDVSDWSESLCQRRNSGQTCLVDVITSPTPVPSEPFWGMSAIRDSVAGCAGSIASKHAKTFTAPVSGNYEVSSVMFGARCDICDVFARLFVDGQQVLVKKGERINSGEGPQPPELKSAVIPLTAGPHTIEMGMTSNIACFGLFRGEFDNIDIKQTTASPSTLPGGPYYSIQLDQSSVTTTRPDTVTIPLHVNWNEGYYAEEVTVTILQLNSTNNITPIVTSVHDAMTYQLFDITFNTYSDTDIGDYEFFISVDGVDSDDTLGEVVTLTVE
jgi:hypothetical protein